MNSERAEILIQALPYIRKFKDKTIVVKYGGHAMVNEELKKAVIHDLILLSYVGIKVVVVHGGGMEINQFLEKTGKESKFVQGQRYTDAETMDIVQMVLCGKVNKEIVSLVEQSGGKAIGLCGLDGQMLQAEKLFIDGQDIGYVGSITKVNTAIIDDCVEKNYIPIIATVATGMEDGKPYNINADIAAAKIAAELGAEKLILLTDVPGIMRDIEDKSSLISELKLQEIPSLTMEGILSKGMIPKVDCCVEAIRRGVKKAHIIDGTVPHSLLLEIFSDEGIGTMIS
ncbi:MAG TPA: acetylglutamate kinase [Epulopiscium sp.]|nr:acetylglutamate kinase [Candidatus Epulonipiscium sp.]